ncbi:OB-fold protein [Neolewinella persica]|uniref:OB-fold protein n=1 Tax=Neolewinella persica TaxID=70998 RepID=UPI00039ABB84|nr:hypothetical protein [Neolewinella persica]
MSKILKIGLPLLIVGGLLAFKFMQPKPLLDIQSATTELNINAGSLYAAFESDEIAANATYVGKVMEVSGSLSEITKDDAGHYVLTLSADSPLGQIVCNLSPKESPPVSSSAIGQIVTVKGVCTGYLFDVVLDNSAIISK